ncbi:MAG: cysteine desulfurase family protein [Desulfobacca sp.]|uniref:cysteine desulfurase family protein n=1 Tax=Desulfobacca sp. TaxID=2067990 RepID=UPI0040499E07
MNTVYLDHAGATPVRPEVLAAMFPWFTERFGNPSAVYDLGARVKDAIEEQRAKVAALVGAEAKNIIFTSSGAEANNLAIKGVCLARQGKGRQVIVSAIEHHSVLNAARYLEKFHDFEATFLPVDCYGLVDPERLAKALTPATVLVSIQHASNEIGTIQAIKQLAAVCRQAGVLFHTDAIATAGTVPLNVEELGVDLLSLNGPALAGPKGIGALYFRRGVRLVPQIHGGIQEDGRRGGTENVPGIIGLGRAAELARQELPQRAVYLQKLRDRLITGVLAAVPEVVFTGHPEQRLPGHASFCFEGIEGEALLFMLSRQGIYANTGSACASKALKTSPVLCAIGIRPDLAQGSLVFTCSTSNQEEEVSVVLRELPAAVAKLRSFSPVWRKRAAGGAA